MSLEKAKLPSLRDKLQELASKNEEIEIVHEVEEIDEVGEIKKVEKKVKGRRLNK